jgi:O-antigen/teichoic acid export membrane protein
VNCLVRGATPPVYFYATNPFPFLSSAFKRLAGQTAFYGVSNIAGRLLNYFLVPLHTYLFSQSQYGTVTEFYAYSSFLYILYTYGMETAYFRFASANKDNPRKVFDTGMLALVGSSLLLSGILFAVASPLATALGYADKVFYVRWFAAIMAADAISALPFARLRMENKPLRYAALKMYTIVLTVVLNIVFLVYFPRVGITHFLGLHGISEGYVFLANLVANVSTALLFAKMWVKLDYKFDGALFKQMLRYAAPLILVGLAGMVNETLDRVLLKTLLPLNTEGKLAQIGIYGACYKLSILMTLFVQAYRMAAEPFFFNEAGAKDSPQTFAKMMNYFVAICAVIFIGIAVNLDIVKRFIDPKFHEGLHVVPVLLLANLCLGVYYNLSVWYKLSDKTMHGAYISIFGAAVTIALNIWWIPIFGYTGSAWATLVCYASMMVVSYFIGQRYFKVPYDVLKFAGYVVAAVAIYLVHARFVAPLHATNPLLYALINFCIVITSVAAVYTVDFKAVLRR